MVNKRKLIYSLLMIIIILLKITGCKNDEYGGFKYRPAAEGIYTITVNHPDYEKTGKDINIGVPVDNIKMEMLYLQNLSLLILLLNKVNNCFYDYSYCEVI